MALNLEAIKEWAETELALPKMQQRAIVPYVMELVAEVERLRKKIRWYEKYHGKMTRV